MMQHWAAATPLYFFASSNRVNLRPSYLIVITVTKINISSFWVIRLPFGQHALRNKFSPEMCQNKYLFSKVIFSLEIILHIYCFFDWICQKVKFDQSWAPEYLKNAINSRNVQISQWIFFKYARPIIFTHFASFQYSGSFHWRKSIQTLLK